MNNASREIWKPIKGFKGYYDVSNFGNVRSKDRNISNGNGFYLKKGINLKNSKTSTGYWKVELQKNGVVKSFKVHRLVASAFVRNKENKPSINHKDGNPLNNNLTNLEWCTQKENVKHFYEVLFRGSEIHMFKTQILSEYVDNQISIKTLSKKYKCNQMTIRKMLLDNKIQIRTGGEIRDKYRIDRKELIKAFDSKISVIELSKKYNVSTNLISVYKYKYKKGMLV